ncbi:hypothetical protein [Pseudonocardia charpentierae]|uniref:Dolichyl-phosphate-mannose-protein mannosyltransferase n=1 Tax=Pseudonocardia charpentierae TaxID=3075545 RepID=A0ABU2NHS2_9PSEU|nr:hypothetical protein [Pseudonocardia sp. DSM 45834]MDT0353512.1 hypothetical protein [Pseudonocardia sp. DSM 45834]
MTLSTSNRHRAVPRRRTARRAPGSSPRLDRLLLDTSLVPLAALAGMLLITRSGGIDDAYISYRYAANLLAGHGLVFNPGERVEGISNPLWTLLLAAGNAVGMPLPVAGHALGVASLVAVVVITRRLALALGSSRGVAVAVATGVALTTDIVAGSTMGLEGALYGALLLAALLVWKGAGRHRIAFAAATCALAATRPEGMVIGALLAAAHLLDVRAPRNARLASAAAGLGGVVALLAARFAYYGQLLPNSVVAKRDGGAFSLRAYLAHAVDGTIYLLLGGGGVIAVVTAALVFWAVQRVVARGADNEAPTWPGPVVPAVLVVGAGFALPLVSGGDWMPHARLVVPYLPIVYALTAVLLSRVDVRRAAAVAAAAPLLMAFVGSHELPLRDDGGANPVVTSRGFDRVGRSLAATGLRDRLVTTDVLGRVGFWAPSVRFHDSLGLTDPQVAHSPTPGSVYGKRNWTHTVALDAAAVLGNDWRNLDAFLRAGPATPYVGLVSTRLTGDRVFVLVDPDVAPRLSAALGDEDARLLPADRALEVWRREVPQGQ